MEPVYISELRAEIKSELQHFGDEHTLKKIASLFLSYKFVVVELIIVTLIVNELFYGVRNFLFGGFSNMFLSSTVALLVIVPVNATLSAVHNHFYKKKWLSARIKTKSMDLVESELREFNKNLDLEHSNLSLPNLDYLPSLAYFSPEYLLFGPRDEMIEGTLNNNIGISVRASQDYLGIEGRLLVISLVHNNIENLRKNSLQCEISYNEKEYVVYTTAKELSECLNATEIKSFIVSFFELFSLRSQGWIKVAKHKGADTFRVDIIIDDYLPISSSLYKQIKKFLMFYENTFLEILNVCCFEKHNI